MSNSSDCLASQHFFVREREKKCSTSGIMQQGGQTSRSPNSLSCEQLGICAQFVESNMDFVRKNMGPAQEHVQKSKGLMFLHVENSSDLQQDNSRESCRISVTL